MVKVKPEFSAVVGNLQNSPLSHYVIRFSFSIKPRRRFLYFDVIGFWPKLKWDNEKFSQLELLVKNSGETVKLTGVAIAS